MFRWILVILLALMFISWLSPLSRYYRPAYFGDGWIGIRLDLGDTDWDHIAEWIRKSWLAVAPKNLAGLMSVADEF